MRNEGYRLYHACLTASYAGPISKWECAVGRTVEEAQRNYEPRRKQIEQECYGGKLSGDLETRIFVEFREVEIPGFEITITPRK